MFLNVAIVLALIAFAVLLIFRWHKKHQEKMVDKTIRELTESFVAAYHKPRPKYICPHCGSRNNESQGFDSDMGHGPSWEVFKCECGRWFDQPFKGNTGLSRS